MTTEENRTAAFLGPRTRWVDARVDLLDVQGLFGGRNVRVTGEGSVFVQVVGPGDDGLREKRYARLAPGRPAEVPPEVADLLALAVREDFVTIGTDDRPGVPDEARMTIVITNGDGVSREAAFWEGTPCPPPGERDDSPRRRFGVLYGRLRRFQADLEQSAEPVQEGPYRPGAWTSGPGSVTAGAGAASNGDGAAPGAVLREAGRIRVRGGCEVLAEALIVLEPRGRDVRVTLENQTPYAFFYSTDGTEVRDFRVRVDREQAAPFLARLQSALEHPRPNLHPSTRDARVEVHLPLASGSLDRQLDELGGNQDVEPVLEAIEALVRWCHAASLPRR